MTVDLDQRPQMIGPNRAQAGARNIGPSQVRAWFTGRSCTLLFMGRFLLLGHAELNK
jgi:hypothetical protein